MTKNLDPAKRDPMAAAVALFLEEEGYRVIWHNDWQFSVGGPGQQWVICIVDSANETDEIEVGPGVDNSWSGDDITDPEYYELADPSSFDKVLALLRSRGCEP